MTFPKTPKVKYKKQQLESAVFEVRFPPILNIDVQLPSSFQNKIRDKFPNYEEKEDIEQTINLDVNQEISSPISTIKKNKRHEFSSSDRKTVINLTRTSFSYTTLEYQTWEHFKSDLMFAFIAILEIYNPAFLSRVGIRYRDIFRKSDLGIELDRSWTELINPCFLGLLQTSVASNVSGMSAIHELNCDDNDCKMRIGTGLVKHIESDEIAFLLDCDTYTSKRIENTELNEKMDYLHEEATSLVRFAITDQLHEIMEPDEE